MIRSPYLQLALMRNEYDVNFSEESISKITKFSQKDYAKVKYKYLIEVLVIQLVPCRVFYFIPSNEDGGSLIGGARIDVYLYLFFNILLVILCMMINSVTEIERDIIWRGDMTRYYKFHGLWILVNILLMAPALYLFQYPKITFLIGACIIYGIFIPAAIFIAIYEKNIPKFQYKFFF